MWAALDAAAASLAEGCKNPNETPRRAHLRAAVQVSSYLLEAF